MTREEFAEAKKQSAEIAKLLNEGNLTPEFNAHEAEQGVGIMLRRVKDNCEPGPFHPFYVGKPTSRP